MALVRATSPIIDRKVYYKPTAIFFTYADPSADGCAMHPAKVVCMIGRSRPPATLPYTNSKLKFAALKYGRPCVLLPPYCCRDLWFVTSMQSMSPNYQWGDHTFLHAKRHTIHHEIPSLAWAPHMMSYS